MLFFFNVRVDHTNVSADELWDEWEKEVAAAEGALAAGKIKSLYKVSGQRREILPVREYADFGSDVRARWK